MSQYRLMRKEQLLDELKRRNVAVTPALNNNELATMLEICDLHGVSTIEAAAPGSNLPPAGFARDEELKRRADALDEAAETLSGEREVYAIDPAKLEIDREIQYELDYTKVTHARRDRVYCWVFYGLGGQKIWEKKAQGWRVVSSGDPECPEAKEVDGTRRVGDTLLMWIPIERWHALMERHNEVRRMQQEGITSRLRELADKTRGRGIKLIEDPSQTERGSGTLMDVMEKRAGAKRVAAGKLDQMLREGTVPGVDVDSKT